MFHYFEIDELKNAVPADYLIQCTDDDGDNEADDGVLEWARQAGEDETDSALEASPRGYNPDDYQVDDDDDGISDNVPGIVKLTALLVAIKRIALRRHDVPENIEKMITEGEANLAGFKAGTLVIVNASTTARTISGNMYEGDLGELTQEDGTEDLPWSGYQ